MILLVTYTAKPHCREAFLRAVQENSLQEIVRQEDGCLEYAYYAAVADAEKILLVENGHRRNSSRHTCGSLTCSS